MKGANRYRQDLNRIVHEAKKQVEQHSKHLEGLDRTFAATARVGIADVQRCVSTLEAVSYKLKAKKQLRRILPRYRQTKLWKLANSRWLIPSLLAIGWGPLFYHTVEYAFVSRPDYHSPLPTLVWGWYVCLPCSALALLIRAIQLIREERLGADNALPPAPQ